MMKNNFILLLVFLFPQFISAQLEYNVASIPEELKEDAEAVVRYSSTEWKVISMKEALQKEHEVITLLNDNAEYFNQIVIFYDDFSKINNVQIKVYDKIGAEVLKLKAKDLIDIPLNDGFSVATDSRVKTLDVSELNFNYPYTIDVSYEIKHKGLLGIPSWHPVPRPNVSVEKSELIVKSVKGYEFKFNEIHIEKKESTEESNIWEVTNIKALDTEKLMPNWDFNLPQVKIAPVEFEIEGFKGNTRSWDEIGRWYNQLLNKTEGLSEEEKKEIQSLVNDEMTSLEKIETIYSFLQKNTRYVSIQLGIGGWKPFDSNFVHEKKYGDCKALTYYTKNMLETIGISSHYVLVNAGDDADDVNVDFPSMQFNHAFLCVPNGADSIWLECTSQTVPFGHLGTFTGDRHVLLISEDGGSIVKTPHSEKSNNKILGKNNITVAPNGDITGNIKNKYFGIEYDESYFSALLLQAKREQEDWIKYSFPIEDFKINDYSFLKNTDFTTSSHLGELNVDFSAREFCAVVGERMFFKPIYIKLGLPNFSKAERKYDFELSNSFINEYEYTYTIPENYSIEKNIKEQKIETEFGTFLLKAKVENNQLIYSFTLEINKGIYPPNKFEEFAKFIKSVKKINNKKVVLLKKP